MTNEHNRAGIFRGIDFLAIIWVEVDLFVLEDLQDLLLFLFSLSLGRLDGIFQNIDFLLFLFSSLFVLLLLLVLLVFLRLRPKPFIVVNIDLIFFIFLIKLSGHTASASGLGVVERFLLLQVRFILGGHIEQPHNAIEWIVYVLRVVTEDELPLAISQARFSVLTRSKLKERGWPPFPRVVDDCFFLSLVLSCSS